MVYRTALAPLSSFRTEVDRLFDEVFTNRPLTATAWHPAADVREDDDAYTYELELPGIAPSAVDVTAENGYLTVRGEKQSTRQKGEEGRWHLVERTAGSFTRVFRLPSSVDAQQVEATFSNGLLTIRAPKAEVRKARKIEVKAN